MNPRILTGVAVRLAIVALMVAATRENENPLGSAEIDRAPSKETKSEAQGVLNRPEQVPVKALRSLRNMNESSPRCRRPIRESSCGLRGIPRRSPTG